MRRCIVWCLVFTALRARAWLTRWRIRFENFLLPRMAGNAQQGQQAVSDLCAELAERYPLLRGKR